MKDEDIEFEPELGDSESAAARDPQASIKKLKEKLKASEKERAEYLDGWQRMKADLANYKKDEEKRLRATREYVLEELLSQFLAVEESFQMAFSNKDAWEKVDQSWRQGVEYIHSQFMAVLTRQGLELINPVGEAFDPREHHSVASVNTDKESEDHQVLEVVKRGYKLGNKVIKAAEVKVGSYIKK